MSILIKNMDMPKTCVGCVLERGGYCEGFEFPRAIKFKTDHITRMDWCPLIELPHGKWIFDDFDGDGLDYECSLCGIYQRKRSTFCPSCGAKMDADEWEGKK